MAKSDVDFAQSVLENAHISIVFLGHLSFLPTCAAILDFKNGHGSSLGFSIGVGDLYLLYLWFLHACISSCYSGMQRDMGRYHNINEENCMPKLSEYRGLIFQNGGQI